MKNPISKTMTLILSTLSSVVASAVSLSENQMAPTFTTFTHESKPFDLQSRKGQWTVLYFYPKADTPGCTKQACAFRDSLEKVRAQGAEVFGISSDSVADQAAFHKKHHLNFTLLADPEGKIVALYGAKMPMLKMSKRWTFILGPDLKIKKIIKDVDPVKDSVQMAAMLTQLKSESPQSN